MYLKCNFYVELSVEMIKKIMGFTLIEIMIVVSIIGILSAIGFPSFIKYMQDGRRIEAQHLALQEISTLERQYTRQGGYPGEGLYIVPVSEFYTIDYQVTKVVGGLAVDVARNDSDGTQFLFSLIAKGTQYTDKCGTMTIDHQGIKTSLIPGMSADCWD